MSYSAAGTRESGDSAWHVLQLLPAGRVERPLMDARARGGFSARSSWRMEADTLHLRVFDGLVGWDLDLVPNMETLTGSGTYLSDARVAGQKPLTVPFHATRTSCAAAP